MSAGQHGETFLLSTGHHTALAAELHWDFDTAGVHHGLVPVLGGAARLELRPALRLPGPGAVLQQGPGHYRDIRNEAVDIRC